MRLTAALALALTLATTAAQADTFRALNRPHVNALPNGDFEVVSRVGAGPAQFWCAAGDYTIRALRAPSASRVYLVQRTGPSVTEPGRKAVTFSLRKPPTTDERSQLGRYFLSLTAVGENLNAALAQQYCYDHLGEHDPRFP